MNFEKLHQAGELDKNDRLAKWIEFFSNEDDGQWRIMASKHPIIKKAVNRLEIISQNPENRYEYEIRQKTLKDMASFKEGAREEGWLEGIAKGKAEGKIEIAVKILRKGIEIETIAEFTGFTIEKNIRITKNIEKDY
ncbi:MAG TPA: Rpn family recombination-promoting nuclease/putative transposase [Bacillus bacterium]|nr:Rpn family recombination-promoting nuclease/putative transposase [Bacillus sp. (in: firmicutes)]